MCKHVQIFASVNLCVCLSQTLSFCVCLYGELSVCFPAAGQGGLVSLWINKAVQFRLLMG